MTALEQRLDRPRGGLPIWLAPADEPEEPRPLVARVGGEIVKE
jgi:hypothetical protein